MEYRFYVYDNVHGCMYFEDMQLAIQRLEDIDPSSYTALGVTNYMMSCDLIVKEKTEYKISRDISKSTFADNEYITEDVVPLLKKTFNVEE